MTMKRKPIKAKLHSANKAISNNDKETLIGQNNKHRVKVEMKQYAIDTYNLIEVSAKVPELDMVDLQGDGLIIKLHKENYIKTVERLASGDTMYDAWFSQVDGRKHTSEKAKWIDNPLPYVWTGVIHKISNETLASYANTQNTLKALNIDFIIPKVGDIVRMTHFMLNDYRYYINEQHRDFIKNPEEFRIVHFDGLVKIHSSMINSIVTDPKDFNRTISPYREYMSYIQHEEVRAIAPEGIRQSLAEGNIQMYDPATFEPIEERAERGHATLGEMDYKSLAVGDYSFSDVEHGYGKALAVADSGMHPESTSKFTSRKVQSDAIDNNTRRKELIAPLQAKLNGPDMMSKESYAFYDREINAINELSNEELLKTYEASIKSKSPIKKLLTNKQQTNDAMDQAFMELMVTGKMQESLKKDNKK